MKCYQLLVVAFTLTTVVSCKKDTLVEVVDVPATPIEVVKTKGGNVTEVKAVEGSFEMYKLPYAYNALEPHFDAATIEIHYSKHHLGYVNSLNKTIIGTKYEILELNDILKNLNLSDAAVRNNAGGFYNHNFFWDVIGPNAGGEPEGSLMESIVKDFGSFEEFRMQFTEEALRLVGSGWVWLISDKTGKLRIVSTMNNDNPLMKNLGVSGIPILNLDMWEHAYYLKFQNRKREYVNTFFSVVNWKAAAKKYDAFSKTSRTATPVVSTTTEVTPAETAPIAIPKPEDKVE